ncbi:leucyl/phenylalanyl-tRNA--protein transferase [Aliifodinibius sp. S!AR15-10]|uniref:leucyl/phenylalanyl-tRNA--protein transferase n=1 Tax=Aliifodinibius sp. S!AR15-10 TaxID=2950437 RepID=UPI00285E57B8|nr:leucyl/phenylalanyl-tRNA--protein transferase [Aliifodinibius sp. S!AR15-10]MDR8393483.1 leucyl/phenylalanyl-tRNA--protein transferase [Aliifodinibius sp. S!AR15-10]
MIEPEVLLSGYARGVFPMADSRHAPEAKWYTASRRGIIPLDKFSVSSNVRRIIRNDHYVVKIDSAFRDVMEGCADRNSTWISDEIIESYCRLNELDYAHSVDVYDYDGNLVGGQYGVSLGAAFFGESMFERAKEASKVALYYCHKALVNGGFELWDTQFWNEHLAQFGCIEISDKEYQERLREALKKKAVFQ